MASAAHHILLLPLLLLSSLHPSHASISLWGGRNSNRDSDGDALGLTEYDPRKVRQVSWKPRAYLYEGFLSHAECDHLIALARKNLQESMVADNESGKSVKSQVRTSSGYFLRKHQDEVVTRIERRIAAWTFLPEENGESIHVLRYKIGQKYEAHYDYFHDKVNQQLGGHRYATVLMYLADVKRGGETVFPRAEGYHQPKDDTWSDCAKEGFAVKPKKGDTVLFFSLYPNTTTDTHSLHGSCPVIEGEKWSATKWIHVRSFDHPSKTFSEPLDTKPPRVEGCVDENELCKRWASAGECEKNPRYMVGDKESPGYCRKSCNSCNETEATVMVVKTENETTDSAKSA